MNRQGFLSLWIARIPLIWGEAGGRFSYIEDPDGAWIEFVETHKVPVIKKLGWYINLKNRPVGKFLPTWMLKAMAFNRVK